MAKPNGAVIYEGPSLIDGAPIVAIVTGLSRASENEKTGDMLQTWILRADMSPLEAVNTRQDSSICGGCIHRGNGKNRKRSCYVQVGQAPRQVWETWQRGKYPSLDPDGLGIGRAVRVGSYGDPAAVPVGVWQGLTRGATSRTGYTHAWRGKLGTPELMAICQASVDNGTELRQAQSKGYGTFRVLRTIDVLSDAEKRCPAELYPGRVTCATCGLCDGARGANIAIPSHGAGAGNYERT
jgi:hypothetical protein